MTPLTVNSPAVVTTEPLAATLEENETV